MSAALAWLGVAIGGLVGAVATMALLGCLVSRHHVVTRSILLPANAATTWQVAANFPGQVSWRRGLIAVDRLADRDGMEVWRERYGRHPLVLRTVEARPPGQLVRRIDDERGTFRGRWDIRIVPIINPSTCRVSIIEEGEVRNPIVRFVHRFAIGRARQVEGYLTDLASRFGSEARFLHATGPELEPPPPGGPMLR